MKKVSVVIPFYSHVEWLYEAIESVLSQTYTNYEIIVVNDGSKEDLSEFLEKYGDKIHYLYQENAGPAAARNKGIRYATGDYIAFEDSDDVWLPSLLEKQVHLMEKSSVKWLHTGFYYWWPETNKMKEVNVSRDFGDVYRQRQISTMIATPSVMLDRAIFSEGNFYFPEGVRNGEDDQLYTKLARHYPLGLVEEPLVKVRMRGTNSQYHAIERFHLRVMNYKDWIENGEKLSWFVHFIYFFYRIYAVIFGYKSNKIKDFLAKCCWIIPYLLERCYVRYLFRVTSKDEKYIVRK